MNATGLHRNALDKFYTKPDIVGQCIEMVSRYIQIHPTDLLIEPSAGDGSFIQGMRGLSPNCAFYDIAPANSEITRLDFLEYVNSSHENISQKIHVIGNPPFGRQSSLAIKFIKRQPLLHRPYRSSCPRVSKRRVCAIKFRKYFI